MAQADPQGAALAGAIHGPVLIGTFINILLYGVSITQVYIYYSNYKRDKLWMKIFIIILFLADTVNTVFDMVFVYRNLILHFGDNAFIQVADWIFSTDPAMTGIIGGMVQSFFAWRVKVLTGNVWAMLAIATCAVCDLLAGVGTAICVGFFPHYLEFLKFKPAVILWLAFSAVADCLITGILVMHLRKKRTGFAYTDDVVDRIIRLTMQTGMLTSVCATIDLVLFLTDPAALHLAFNFPLSKLYTNSLLSSLNSRPNDAQVDPSINSARRQEVVKLGKPSVRPEVYVNVESHEMMDSVKRLPSDNSFGGSYPGTAVGYAVGYTTDSKRPGSSPSSGSAGSMV